MKHTLIHSTKYLTPCTIIIIPLTPLPLRHGSKQKTEQLLSINQSDRLSEFPKLLRCNIHGKLSVRSNINITVSVHTIYIPDGSTRHLQLETPKTVWSSVSFWTWWVADRNILTSSTSFHFSTFFIPLLYIKTVGKVKVSLPFYRVRLCQAS
jgi:hypothetical protein